MQTADRQAWAIRDPRKQADLDTTAKSFRSYEDCLLWIQNLYLLSDNYYTGSLFSKSSFSEVFVAACHGYNASTSLLLAVPLTTAAHAGWR